jgi:hypothetical protein
MKFYEVSFFEYFKRRNRVGTLPILDPDKV